MFQKRRDMPPNPNNLSRASKAARRVHAAAKTPSYKSSCAPPNVDAQQQRRGGEKSTHVDVQQEMADMEIQQRQYEDYLKAQNKADKTLLDTPNKTVK